MTREEAKKNLVAYMYYAFDDLPEDVGRAIDMAIRALEQQEFILDKIRAEIRKLDDINPDYPMDRTIRVSRNEVLQIIDKYREGEKADADDCDVKRYMKNKAEREGD